MSHFPTFGNLAAPRSAERSVFTPEGSAAPGPTQIAKGVSRG